MYACAGVKLFSHRWGIHKSETRLYKIIFVIVRLLKSFAQHMYEKYQKHQSKSMHVVKSYHNNNFTGILQILTHSFIINRWDVGERRSRV